ncbi:MAG: ketol-acid reductoisomerase [Gammaproteobacteria bacterium]|nr:ketol-acid reductoisomerase [Gammaproteobacteria bacterium]
MATLYENDVNPALILDRKVAVLGFGAQGRAHALNLKESGVDVVVGLRDGSASAAACRHAGVSARPIADAVSSADVVMMLVPDEAQAGVHAVVVDPLLRPGSALLFAHGYNVHFDLIHPRADLDVLMVAPLGIGDQVRERYADGGGVPALLAVHHDATGDAAAIGASYAWANGHARAGIIETSFRDETETDLFAEQVVLCGGLTHLISNAFDTLVDAGYPEELAYFSCLHEVKLIADLIYRRGIAGMRESISSTAEYGDYTRGPRVIGAGSRLAMSEILNEIRNGSFSHELAGEFRDGMPVLKKGRAAARGHKIEQVGARLRDTMVGFQPGKDED